MASGKLKNVYLNKNASIVGPLEKEGLLKDVFSISDYYGKRKTFEQAEIGLNEYILNELLNDKVDLVVGGELSNQLAHTTYALKNRNVAYVGVYSACASFIEGLIIASLFNNAKEKIVITSAHNLTAEKQFRYPIEYGSPRPLYSTFTATGSVGVILSKTESNYMLDSYTIGSLVELSIKDSSNMGAVMAPAAYDTIKKHLKELKRDIKYYDLILTGDLGEYGLEILKELLANDSLYPKKIIDAGCEVFAKNQDTYAGASGPVVLPLVLFNRILKNRNYHTILLVGTGSMHSKTLVDQKLAIPAISHAVSLEVLK